MHDYDVWPAPFPLPEWIVSFANALSLRPGKLRDSAGVDLVGLYKDGRILAVDALMTDGYCPWHDDMWLDTRYSALLIVRNDVDGWVEARGYEPIKSQPVGTLVQLNIHREHRQDAPDGYYTKEGLFICAVLNYNAPLAREEIETRFREKIA